MNFFRYSILSTIIIFCFWIQSNAQNSDSTSTQNSLQGQFEDLKKKSSDYEVYEVVKKSNLNSFWKSITDSIAARDGEIAKGKSKIVEQSKSIDDLKNQLAETEKALEESKEGRDNLSFIGIVMNKDTYIYISCFVIFILLGVAGIAFSRFKASNEIAQEKIKEYEEATEELQDYKKKTYQKETKLRRELQTEINKNEELNQKLLKIQNK
ncbi:hypothetical protein [Flexithrix dorotheae]|uniref:hypothetical protein n=1 Tax=Flexithrix dorotheae TaxID=70993 RepID=UPI00036F7DE8|nr:hypothetical protein [Flexithrix dorotheae]